MKEKKKRDSSSLHYATRKLILLKIKYLLIDLLMMVYDYLCRDAKIKTQQEIHAKKTESINGNVTIEIGTRAFNLTELGDAVELHASCIEDATAYIQLHLGAVRRTLRSSNSKNGKAFYMTEVSPRFSY